MEMTDIKYVIAELRELDGKASVAPWCKSGGCKDWVLLNNGDKIRTNEDSDDDIDLICAMRNALPQLLEYVEELERRLAQSEKLEHCSCCNQSKEEWVCLE